MLGGGLVVCMYVTEDCHSTHVAFAYSGTSL